MLLMWTSMGIHWLIWGWKWQIPALSTVFSVTDPSFLICFLAHSLHYLSFSPGLGASHLQSSSLQSPKTCLSYILMLGLKGPEADPIPLSVSAYRQRIPISFCPTPLSSSFWRSLYLQHIWKFIGYSVYNVILQSTNY